MATNNLPKWRTKRQYTLRLTWEEVIDLEDVIERRLDWLHTDNNKSHFKSNEEAIAVLERIANELYHCRK
jgi:hypothetical protein